jgi:hypothetical protein
MSGVMATSCGSPPGEAWTTGDSCKLMTVAPPAEGIGPAG